MVGKDYGPRHEYQDDDVVNTSKFEHSPWSHTTATKTKLL